MPPKSSIPAWQRSDSLPGAEDPTKPGETAAPVQEETSAKAPEEHPIEIVDEEETLVAESKTLREQAAKFLQDPSIQDAGRERKIVFLESKGVKRDDIEALLGKDPEESAVQKAPILPPKPVQPFREVPPVITYPEFLVHSSKPPPLVTTDRLLNTAYIAAGLYATIYGLSKYIIGPQQAALSESRHEFLGHTKTQVERLNFRLSTMVSKAPPSRPATSSGLDQADDKSETSDEDPTELFHRDFGTQTSPSLSRRASSSELSDLRPADVVSGHENRLKIMASHLRDLQQSNSSIEEKEDNVTKQLTSLTSYLNDLTYSSPYYRYGGGNYGGWSGTDTSGNKDDEIDKFKTEIRGVKGVLLSTRNFPRGVVG
ncbi:hypothetical protein EG328_003054 [Venturia inaequalis]|uniref:Peroxisomal membrane protein PEX14 n=1 Tax=Venturia inaequalis TaxID=5025 RepID=A0A8H3V9I8_VENIN|nr:hypothetical protein EG327_005416 [Venturia inaequalis]KAE9987330.1 hypothetical protein EG328_003054 [Venturia inaequalis]